jgi:hypothetical protein
MKKVLLTLAAFALIAAPAMAATPYVLPSGGGLNTKQYHSYDGLICTDCHTLHNSEDGVKVGVDGTGKVSTGAGPFRELLKRGDWTDMCLSCHKQGQNTASSAALPGVSNGIDATTGIDYGNWTAPIVMTTDGVDPAGVSMPGGDFYWSNIDPKRGHNPAYTKGSLASATSDFMAADPTLGSLPPGGAAITDGEWSCHSCHGMHSRFSDTYSAWRQLKRKVNGIVVTGNETAGTVETSGGNSGATTAGFEPIRSNSRGDIVGTDYVATRPDGHPLEGASLFADESDTNKNVYRGGFSSFCAACHGDFHGGAGETRGTANGKTNINNSWQRHPTNVKMNETAVVMSGSSAVAGSKYGITTYTKQITNKQTSDANPVGYDWRYPLVQPDTDFTVTSADPSMATAATALGESRIMCLTCHKAHASKFENMTRWDANGHAFQGVGEIDPFTGVPATQDNPAFGCGKCHQKGGAKAFVKSGF